ncbi:MAG: leucine-rich repeat domain-containing protein [Bacteroides sp.]|nr:leucine-rich repeat domain-containing protein [Bacteroides sp.]
MTLTCPEVTEIPASAYEGNTAISKYYFPKVKTIGEKAFKGATLTKIGCADEDLIIGTTDAAGNKTSSLTTIGANALEGITGLIEIDAPALTSFGNTPFGYNTSLAFEKVLLPKYDWSDPLTAALLTQGTAMKEIDLSGTNLVGNGINLSGKANLAKVILSPNTAISEGVFKSSGTGGGVTELKVSNINKITSVGKDAFFGCSKLAGDIKFENTIAAIAAGAFNGTAIKSFDFTGITTIGEGAFQGATALTSIVVPSVTTLEKNVFNNALNLANVTLSNVTTIKEGALDGLASGAQIILPKVLTNIDPTAFSTSLGVQAGTEAAPIIVGSGTIDYNLLVNKSQTGVKGNDLTWKAADGKFYKATFTKITAVF